MRGNDEVGAHVTVTLQCNGRRHVRHRVVLPRQERLRAQLKHVMTSYNRVRRLLHEIYHFTYNQVVATGTCDVTE